jgi:hypothetical protein
MMRRALTCALLLVVLTTLPMPAASAQDTPSAPNPKDTPIAVGEGAGMYVQAAAPSLTGAFDRAVSEIDASGADWTPRQVKDASFRRRLLELRLLMDGNAFAYEKDRLRGYRDIVDRAYESVGIYQDLTDIEKELGTTVNPDVVNGRRVEMNEGLAQMRDPNLRREMRAFFAAPLGSPRKGDGPGIWDLTGSVASNSFDAIGNAAELQTGIVRHLQGADLGVSDIFDPNQAFYFHTIRKQIRDVVLLSKMFPETKDATVEVAKPLNDLVDDYGDALEAFTAYEFALQQGMGTEKVAAELRREFERALMMKQQLVDTHGLDAMAVRLNEVREAHRR